MASFNDIHREMGCTHFWKDKPGRESYCRFCKLDDLTVMGVWHEKEQARAQNLASKLQNLLYLFEDVMNGEIPVQDFEDWKQYKEAKELVQFPHLQYPGLYRGEFKKDWEAAQ